MTVPAQVIDSDEAGFTLLEMIFAIAITSIILVAMSLAITESFTNSTTTKRTIDRTALNNFASRYFAEDVASSTGAPTFYSTAASEPAPPCGGLPSDRTTIDIPANGPAGAVTISYVRAGTNPTTLSRRVCSAGATPALVGASVLGKTNDAFTATSACDVDTGGCILSISWGGTNSFALQGTRRLVSG